MPTNFYDVIALGDDLAGLIGATAGYGMYLAALESTDDDAPLCARGKNNRMNSVKRFMD